MINDIVKQMLDQHGGGQIFFDHLDEAIRNEDVLGMFYDLVYQRYLSQYEYNGIIMSGKFGRAMMSYTGIQYDCTEFFGLDCITVNGSLRGDDEVEDFIITDRYEDGFKPKFLFLDDSFYSGKTRDKIAKKLESYGAELVHTFVLYDGSIEKDETVSSMYRYYDNH